MKTRKPKNPPEKFETIGHITVDAGIVQVGDPCYQKGEEWGQYLEDTGILDMDTHVAIPHDGAQKGGNYDSMSKAVVVSSGFGDGVYPVQIKKCRKTGRVKALRVNFF